MEIDISRKARLMIKFALPAVLAAAVLLNLGIWLYGQNHAYLTFYDAHVVGTFLQTKTLTDGTLDKLLVNDGDAVTAGQPLAQIHPNITQDDLDKLQQAVDQAQQQYDTMANLSHGSTRTVTSAPVSSAAPDDSQYQAAAARADKMRNLYNIGAVSKTEYDNAQAAADAARASINTSSAASSSSTVVNVPSGVTPDDLKMAQTRLNQAKLALQEAQKSTNLTQLFAAADGTAYYTDVEEGGSIKAGQNIMNIATSNYLWLEIKTNKTQADKLQEGAYAECKIGDKVVGGTVEEIIEPSDDEPKYTIKITIPSDKMGGIKPNMISTVKIALKK